MSERIPGYPDPSFNSEESEAYAPSEDAAEVPEALAPGTGLVVGAHAGAVGCSAIIDNPFASSN